MLSSSKVVAVAFFVMSFSLMTGSNNVFAQSITAQTVIATDLSSPWSLALLPRGEFLVTEKTGSIAKITATGNVTRLTGLPSVVAERQGGVLGVTLDPDFAQNNKIYVCLVRADDEGKTGSEVYSATLSGNELSDVTNIFTAQPKVNSGFHFGCRLAFTDDKSLFITLGDRGAGKELTQDLDNHYGKVIRVLPDGTPHPENAFLDSKVPEVYSIGHRNVQGIVWHPTEKVMWAHEHGPKGGDELNRLKVGANYGWPTITYGVNYNGTIITDQTEAPGLERPLTYWVPSIAPSGMAFFNDDILIGSLKFRHLRYLEMEGDNVVKQTELLNELNARIRDVQVSSSNVVYVLTDEPKGRLIAVQLQMDAQ
ncbi:PQQ-dependent sugar dehydrogenase [Glaciecola sp. HTCC2999]|uniref:PQQ-dependent sugar dehydrogenase n=1 Tax=Glaciecola sp. HTCC2999 TaxID=455436 RepID=UPI0000E0E424|nr:PQQ-dependent sugar dehydrogenase [Glaciecola sp. HTCC2999]